MSAITISAAQAGLVSCEFCSLLSRPVDAAEPVGNEAGTDREHEIPTVAKSTAPRPRVPTVFSLFHHLCI